MKLAAWFAAMVCVSFPPASQAIVYQVDRSLTAMDGTVTGTLTGTVTVDQGTWILVDSQQTLPFTGTDLEATIDGETAHLISAYVALWDGGIMTVTASDSALSIDGNAGSGFLVFRPDITSPEIQYTLGFGPAADWESISRHGGSSIQLPRPAPFVLGTPALVPDAISGALTRVLLLLPLGLQAISRIRPVDRFSGFSRSGLPSILCGLTLAFSPGPAHAADRKADPGWRTLPLITDGQVDPGWVHIGYGGFAVDGDCLRTECDPKGLGLLVYKKEKLGNCQIRVVFRAKETKSNAGLYVRLDDGILDQVNHPGASFDRNAAGKISDPSMKRVIESAEREEGPWYAVHHGYEVQIMDAGDKLHRTGAIYSLAPSSATPARQPGEWRTMIVTLSGDRILVDVDGKRVTTFDAAATPPSTERKWYEPKRDPKRPQVGYIGLQNHDPGDIVWFREVSVRMLE